MFNFFMKYDVINIEKSIEICKKLNIKWNKYLKIISRNFLFYSFFYFPKKKGGYRKISKPTKDLSDIQKFIYDEILKKIPISDSAVGFVEKKNIKLNATLHQKNKFFLIIDIKQFFNYIKGKDVFNLFKSLGYNKKVSFDLTRICTVQKGIPQGACTSPALSNIIFKSIDEKISTFCQEREILYTRYADDLVFSSNIKENIDDSFLKKISFYLNKKGFFLNKKKIRRGEISHGVNINGLLTFSDRIIIPRKYIKKIYTELYFIKKYGVLNHKNHVKIENLNYLSHLKGKILFVKYIEREIGEKLENIFNKITI